MLLVFWQAFVSIPQKQTAFLWSQNNYFMFSRHFNICLMIICTKVFSALLYQLVKIPPVRHSLLVFNKQLSLQLYFLHLQGYGMRVSGREGGGGSALVWEFALRVIFLKKFYQWSYIYLKHLIVKHVFVLVIFEGKCYKKKSGQYGTFLCHVFLGREGDWTFQPRYLIFLSLILNEWMSESSSVLPFQIFHENTAHHHCH